MASSTDLRAVFSAARPLIEEWLDVAEQIAALREMATDKGLDWSQVKALVKAQVQDERAGETKRVQRIIEKAEFASAYADMLGLAKMNEENFSARSYADEKGREGTTPKASISKPSSAETVDLGTASFDAETGEITDNQDQIGGNGPDLPVEASTDKQAAGASRPTNSNSQASPLKPADGAGEAPSSSQASPATLSDLPISTTPSFAGRVTGEMPDIPAFLDRRQPKAREWEGA